MSFNNPLEQQGEVISEINMTPLVDVMLVLLVIFILTMPVLTHSVQLDLPRASNKPTPPALAPVQIGLDAQGVVYWNSTRVSHEQLQARLAEAARSSPQPEIQMRADRRVVHEEVVRVMAAVQRAGLLRLGFITEPEALSR